MTDFTAEALESFYQEEAELSLSSEELDHFCFQIGEI